MTSTACSGFFEQASLCRLVLRWVSGDRLLLCWRDASERGWRQIATRLGFPDVTDFLAQRLAVSLVAARGSVPEGTAIYSDLHKHRSSWRLRGTSKTILDMQDSWAQDSKPFYRRGLRFCGDKDRQRRVYCHVIEEAAKLAVGPGTTCAEDDVVDCDLAVVICCGWNNAPKTGDKLHGYASEKFGELVLGAAAFASLGAGRRGHEDVVADRQRLGECLQRNEPIGTEAR